MLAWGRGGWILLGCQTCVCQILQPVHHPGICLTSCMSPQAWEGAIPRDLQSCWRDVAWTYAPHPNLGRRQAGSLAGARSTEDVSVQGGVEKSFISPRLAAPRIKDRWITLNEPARAINT